MIQSSKSIETLGDRVKLPFAFDVAKMQADVQSLRFNNFLYYEAVPLRAPAHMVDPSLPFPPPADDYADGSWTDWLDTKALKEAPYITEVVNFFRQYCTVNLVRLLRLGGESTVKEHTDPTLGLHIEKSMVRLTIPVFTNEEVTFFLNNKPVEMEMGECWYLRLTDPHRIINASNVERINLTIDVVPNEWVRTQILEKGITLN